MSLDEILHAANVAVDETADWLRHADVKMFEQRRKKSGEEVTQADITIQQIITERLSYLTPGVPVVGEESQEHELPSRSYWLIDPIDGTMNLARGAPYYAVSVAYVQDSKPVVGVVYAPALNLRRGRIYENVTTELERGSQAKELHKAIVGITGTGHLNPGSADLVAEIHRHAYRIRMHGSMALDLLGVAEGWIDACVCLQPHPWDIAAGIVLALADGNTVLGQNSQTYSWRSPYLIAGSHDIAIKLRQIVQDNSAALRSG